MSISNNLTGKTLNKRYEILRPLGKGGMGKVYLAKDIRFGKQVVVKVPTMEVEDKEFKARFMREIASLAALEHPHIVTTVDWGEIEGIPFLVLRYLGGGNLRDRITDSQGLKKLMPLEGLNQWLPQIASALDFIHSKKWVHRDLKPDNILFDEVGNPYLADFGIAKALEGAPMGVKTTMGAFIGTPQYMAPEMHLGKGIGPRADQFGLAVLVYESLAGEIPFTGATPTAIFLDVMRGKPKLIHELVSEISLEKSNALMKGLAKDQDKRHDNCGLFAREITGIKLGIGQLFQGYGEVSISGQIEPLQMKPPIKTGFPAILDQAPSMTELAVTKVVREGVIPLASQMPAKVEEVFISPAIASVREIRQRVKPLSFQVPAKVDEAFILVEIPSTMEIRKSVTPLSPQMPVKGEAAFISPALASAREIRKGVTPLSSQMPAKVEAVFILPELPSAREMRENVKPLSSQMPLKVKEGEPYILNREKNRGCLRVILWVGGILMLVTAIVLWKQTTNLEAPFTETKAKEVQKAVAKNLQKEVEEKVDLGKGVSLDIVLIPAGKFKMGDPGADREVNLTKPFYMGKYEVTQEQWKAVMGEENKSSNTKGEKLPVTNVSWDDCQNFIKKLNEKNKGKYRLPTEAEWEYACRAGTTTVYSFGDEITTNDANYDDPMKGLPVAVGGYKPNAFGIYDMHGNVWEWCNDRYDSLQNGAVKDPNGPAIGETHVMRGGSFSESNARSSSRTYGLAPFRWNNDGFRLAKDTSVRKP